LTLLKHPCTIVLNESKTKQSIVWTVFFVFSTIVTTYHLLLKTYLKEDRWKISFDSWLWLKFEKRFEVNDSIKIEACIIKQMRLTINLIKILKTA